VGDEHTRAELPRAEERVLLYEFEKATLAMTDLFGRLAPTNGGMQ
jgi:hypothetical protein